ncbi:MAG TPA: hypothetical protein VIY90_18810 [Steroidobacteraceae bacterium]
MAEDLLGGVLGGEDGQAESEASEPAANAEAYALAGRLGDQPFSARAITASGDIWRPEMRPFRQDARFSALMAYGAV